MNSSLGGTSLEGSQVYLGKQPFFKSQVPSFLFVWHTELHVKLHDRNYISIQDLNPSTFDVAAALNIFLASISVDKDYNLLVPVFTTMIV